MWQLDRNNLKTINAIEAASCVAGPVWPVTLFFVACGAAATATVIVAAIQQSVSQSLSQSLSRPN